MSVQLLGVIKQNLDRPLMKMGYVFGAFALSLIFLLMGMICYNDFSRIAVFSLIAGFDYSGYLTKCSAFTSYAKRFYFFGVSVGLLPLLALVCTSNCKKKRGKEYIVYLLLLGAGLLSGVTVRVLILRKELHDYTQLMEKPEYGYYKEHFQFEEWAFGGMCVMAVILLIKNTSSKNVILDSSRSIDK